MPQNLRDFKSLFEHVLARVRWETDFFIFSNVSMDTLDYTSGTVNKGSKAILLGLGEAVRNLPDTFSGELPGDVSRAEVFCAGCLVVEGLSYAKDATQASRLARESVFEGWQLIILHDDASVAASVADFLWSTWTRFEPAADVQAANTSVKRHHLSYQAPIVIDARMKPGFPDELIVRPDISDTVDRRWRDYFPKGLGI